MAILACSGANAGALSPFAPTGIVANGLMTKIGLEGAQWTNYVSLLVAQSFVGFACYFMFGGIRLLAAGKTAEAVQRLGDNRMDDHMVPFTWQEKLTLAIIAALILSVLVFHLDITIGAFIGVAVLSLARAADEKEGLKAIP
jgi:hypothetical protein